MDDDSQEEEETVENGVGPFGYMSTILPVIVLALTHRRLVIPSRTSPGMTLTVFLHPLDPTNAQEQPLSPPNNPVRGDAGQPVDRNQWTG